MVKRIGYGDMNAVFAGLAGLSAIASFIWLGGKPAVLVRRSSSYACLGERKQSWAS